MTTAFILCAFVFGMGIALLAADVVHDFIPPAVWDFLGVADPDDE